MDERQVRDRVVAVLLAVRNRYLQQGAATIKHWTQLHERVRAAARSSATIAEWISQLERSLAMAGVDKAICSATVALVEAVGSEHGAFLDLIEREHGYLMALTRQAADQERARKQTQCQLKRELNRLDNLDIVQEEATDGNDPT